MLYTATPTGMRTLAGDYREGDFRWARVRRVDNAAGATRVAAAEQHVVPTRAARLIAHLPHAR